MDHVAIKNYVIEVISQQETGLNTKINLFNKLFENNLLDKTRLLKACINHYYDAQFKVNECNTRITIRDTADEFNISEDTVKNSIYKFSWVRLDF